MSVRTNDTFRLLVALLLTVAVGAAPVLAGITVTGADGITVTGADGVRYINPSGITVTGADGFLSFLTNGISTDGIVVTGADGSAASSADGVTYTGANSVAASHPDGITVTGADGITVTGADGITVTGADGNRYQAEAVSLRRPDGITVTGADGITVTGADGVERVGASGITVTGADGITVTGADGITVTGADGITVTGADGQLFSITPSGITISGPAGIAMTGANGITVTGADGITVTGADMAGPAVGALPSGLQSVDPELAVRLDRLTDDSNVNAVLAYHRLPTDADINDLKTIGISSGTRYRALPMITLTATRRQLIAVSHLPAVRSIYGNRTLQPTRDANISLNNVAPIVGDVDLSSGNSGLALSGRGVTVAVLDTGLDATHGDFGNRVVQNVKLADAQSLSAGFLPPVNAENLANTDQAYGHGTFVAGIVAGSGLRSGGKYEGIAPGAQIVGLSAGDLNLSYVLAGFDYLLDRGAALNVRVVNCSFSANTVFDLNDPVNIATKLLTEANVNVVFSAGNTGSGPHTLNPYAVAPWVVSVGATDEKGRLADFSSRGDFGSSLFQPTLVAPGVSLVSLRTSTSPSLAGVVGLTAGDDLKRLTASEIPYYTTGSGTSFSAPQVAGAIALMIEANPALTPRDVRGILQRTATPLPGFYAHEAGAGMLNAYGAVLEAAFPERRMGQWRATLNQSDVLFINDPVQMFSGTVFPLSSTDAPAIVPENAVLASIQIGWGALLSATNLSLSVFDSGGRLAAKSDAPLVPGITGGREQVAVRFPVAGTWKARVSGALGMPQYYSGVIQITRVQYGPLKDLGDATASSRDEVLQALRTFTMSPIGNRFRPNFTVSRAQLAETLVRAGRAPQYLPAIPTYSDVRDRSTMLFVESVQSSTAGPFFLDVFPGGRFLPNGQVDRVTAAVALVRAAGLRGEAEANSGIVLPYTDTANISAKSRGYIATAVARNLLTVDGNAFRPQSALTRGELAHAAAVLTR
jgi:serine protease AprX